MPESVTYSELHMIIDGEKLPVGHRRTHSVVNPATGAVLGELPHPATANATRASVALAQIVCLHTALPPGGLPFPNAPLKADRQELPFRCARTGLPFRAFRSPGLRIAARVRLPEVLASVA